MTAEPLPSWFFPPAGGWTADDLDRLPPEAPRHLELIDGALIVMPPQTGFCSRVMRRLANALESVAPSGLHVDQEMTVKLGRRQRPEPDVLVWREAAGSSVEWRRRTFYLPEEVLLVVEIVSEESEESEERDRTTKPQKYAQAGIRHFWRVEEEEGEPVVHVFELEPATGTYVVTGIVQDRLKLEVPFPLDIDVAGLTS